MKELNSSNKYLPSNVLKGILDGMDGNLFVSDIHTGEMLFINDSMRERFSQGDAAVGRPCWSVLHPGTDKRCDFCPVYQLLENPGTPVVWEEYNEATGRYYKHIDRIIEWYGGKTVHLQHSTDITDFKLAEASLKKRLEQQELMSAISQSFTGTQDAQQLIYEALKMAGKFMGVNQAFLSKYKKDEGFLECLFEWCDEEGRPFIGGKHKWPITPDMDIYKNLTLDRYAAINDYTLLTHPNFETVKDYDLRAFLNLPIEVSGEFWGIIGFVINKRTYEWSESDIHLGKLIAGVFSGVVRRNIAEEGLVRAKEIAEQSSRAKGEFLSRMSHEIRTPINAIIGMTDIAKNSGNQQKMEYCLGRIDNASRHLLGLINDILDMSKIEANKLELSPVRFDFEKMLIDITSVINFRIEEKKQSLIINIDKDMPSAFIGDEMRLSQVIMNLLSNSNKFTPEGGTIILSAKAAELSDEAATLLFEVTDCGIGISKEQQDRLFSPFEQANGGITREYGGTGLGLTISKGIVELMEGRIWVESELGKGSKFSFTVKMTTCKGLLRPELANSIDKRSLRILVVDEAEKIRDYFLRVIPEFGLSCDVTAGRSEALEIIRRKAGSPYSFIFVGWSTSDSGGIELIKELGRVSRDSAVILMITETDWRNVEKEATAAGIDRFIFKPLFPSALLDIINESMGAALEAKATESATRAYDFKGHTLLVAEDIDINREIVLAILEDTKVSIDFAYNGVQALSMVEDAPEKYSLILMDIHMPEMDGYEATKRIRALGGAKNRHIPIIAMTANVFREDIDRCINAGMDDHIGKPINTGELFSKLDKYLST